MLILMSNNFIIVLSVWPMRTRTRFVASARSSTSWPGANFSKLESRTMCAMWSSSIVRDIWIWWSGSKNCSAGLSHSLVGLCFETIHALPRMTGRHLWPVDAQSTAFAFETWALSRVKSGSVELSSFYSQIGSDVRKAWLSSEYRHEVHTHRDPTLPNGTADQCHRQKGGQHFGHFERLFGPKATHSEKFLSGGNGVTLGWYRCNRTAERSPQQLPSGTRLSTLTPTVITMIAILAIGASLLITQTGVRHPRTASPMTTSDYLWPPLTHNRTERPLRPPANEISGKSIQLDGSGMRRIRFLVVPDVHYPIDWPKSTRSAQSIPKLNNCSLVSIIVFLQQIIE